MRLRHLVSTITLTATLLAWGRPLAAQTPSLKIVVIAGEDAINVVQQKTAVAPVVEVRDRNDQPISGAAVTFAVRSGRATISGSRTLTVTTNSAGRAIASGLTPTGTGALKISASAAFQGQATAVTITQTNVMTAAQAAAMSGATGAGASGTGAGGAGASSTGATTGTAGTGAAGGTSGGLSVATIGVVGGAAAGGAVIANNVLGGPGGTAYTGTFAGPIVVTGPAPFCGFTLNITGTLVIRIEEINSSMVRGSAQFDEDNAIHYNASCRLNDLAPFHESIEISSLSGTQDNISFTYRGENTFNNPDGSGTTGRRTKSFSFTGAFDGTQITGVLTDTEANESITGPRITASGTTAFPITLR